MSSPRSAFEPARSREFPHLASIVSLAVACSGGQETTASDSSTEPASTTGQASTSVTSEAGSTSNLSDTSAITTSTTIETGSTTDDPSPPPELTVLATGFPRSRPIAVHGEYVYWGAAGPPMPMEDNGKILRVPQLGGTVEALVAGLKFPSDLKVLGNQLFWIDTESGDVMRANLDGTQTAPLAQGYFAGESIDGGDQFAYWVAGGGSQRLARVPLVGGIAEDLVSNLDKPSSVITLPDSILWLEGGGTNQLRSIPKLGGMISSLGESGGVPRSLVKDDEYVYWVSTAEGAVRRVPIGGGIVEIVVQGTVAPFGLAVDDTNIFWTSTLGSVYYVHKDGGRISLLVEGLMRPERIALTASHVYFTDFDAGEVLRIGKPM